MNKLNIEYFQNKSILKNKPIISNLEIISQCNLKCSMCISDPHRKKRMLNFEEIKTIIGKNLSYFEGQWLWLHHYGEPLLHPDLIKIIEYLTKKKINVRLSTNALLLNTTKSKKIINSGLKEIVFSLDTLDGKKYLSTRVGGDFNKALNNICKFINLKKKLNKQYPKTQILYLKGTSSSEEEIQKFLDFWKNKGVDWIGIKELSNRGGHIRDKSLINSLLPNHCNKLPCYYLWSSLIILSDGSVTTCCTDLKGENIIGNVFEDTIENIWNNDRIKLFRKLHLDSKYGQINLCKSCNDKLYYSSEKEIIDKIPRATLIKNG